MLGEGIFMHYKRVGQRIPFKGCLPRTCRMEAQQGQMVQGCSDRISACIREELFQFVLKPSLTKNRKPQIKTLAVFPE
jgi:hypothetical protein